MKVNCHMCKKEIILIENTLARYGDKNPKMFKNEKDVIRDEIGFICLQCFKIQDMEKQVQWYKKVKGII